MLQRLSQFVRYAFGARSISVESESPTRLELRYGYTRTIFDKPSQQVIQGGKPVATLPLVERVELHQPRDQEGPLNWFVTIHVKGSRRVEVGQITDETEASMIGARIASIVDKPVVVGR